MKQVSSPMDIFILIGAEKCGSTSLSSIIRAHPEVHDFGKKGFNFFLSDECKTNGNTSFYVKFSHGAKKAFESCGSGEYAAFPEFPDFLSYIDLELFKPKFIYTVRDPLERIESEYRMFYPKGRYKNALSNGVDIRALFKSNYWLQTQRIVKKFGKESILILNFDEWKSNHALALSQISNFMGIHNAWPIELKNRKDGIYWSAEVFLREQLPFKLNRIYRLLPTRLKRLLGQIVVEKLPSKASDLIVLKSKHLTSLTPHQKQYVAVALKPDIDRFCVEFDIDSSTWRAYKSAIESAQDASVGNLGA